MDKLVQELETIIKSHDWNPHWKSLEKRIRCFLHVLNLVSQSLLRQFDAPKTKTGAGIAEFGVDNEREPGDIDAQTEAELAATSLDKERQKDPREGDDDDEGLVDEIKQMPRAEAEKVQRDTKPVRLAIAKVRRTSPQAQFELIAPQSPSSSDNFWRVIWLDSFWFDTDGLRWLRLCSQQLRKIAHMTIHSPTVLLPRWFASCRKADLKERKIPRDVCTRWNSTFDMIKFCIDYKSAIQDYTAGFDGNMSVLDLHEDEWIVAEQLCRVLVVSHTSACLYLFSR